MKDFFVVYEDEELRALAIDATLCGQVSLQKSLHVSCGCPVGCTNTPRLFPKNVFIVFVAGRPRKPKRPFAD